jgi:hypothetical protein
MTAFNGSKNKSRAAFLKLLDECIESDKAISVTA